MGIGTPSTSIAPSYNYIQEESFANPLYLNANDGNAFYCEITGDTTIVMQNTRLGGSYLIQLVMDDTGGHTVSLNSQFRCPLSGSGTVDTDPNAMTLISVIRTKGGALTYNIINVNCVTTSTSSSTTTTGE